MTASTIVTTSWEALLEPRAVAVLGASEERFYARNAVRRLLRTRLADRTHLVNPNRDTAFGRVCVPTVADVADTVDVAIVAVRAERTVQAVRECAAAGVRAAIVVAAGLEDEDELRAVAEASGMVVLGPSSLGVFNVTSGIELFAGGEYGVPRSGAIGLASQSGGMLQACISEATRRALGFTRLVAVGSGACTSAEAVIEQLVEDDETEVVCAVVEGLREPDVLVRAAAVAAAREKPIVLLKLGRSEATARLAVTHTGTLTGDDAFSDTLLADLGVTRVGSLEEMFDAAGLLAATPRSFWRPIRGVAIVSLSGGLAGVAADALASTDVVVPEYSDTAQASTLASDIGGLTNPLEFGRQMQAEHPGAWDGILDTIASEDALDALLLVHLGFDPEQARSLERWRRETGKLVALSDNSPGVAERGDDVVDVLRALRMPAPLGPVAAARGIRGWVEFFSGLDACGATELVAATRGSSSVVVEGGLREDRARAIFAEHGIASPRERTVSSVGDAVEAAAELGYPVVLKALVDGVSHKTEQGFVRVGLGTPQEVSSAAEELLAHGTVLVQELVRGLELILSVDNTRGHLPLVLLGRGGELVELELDRVFAVGPVGRDRARRLVERLAVAPALAGYRGRPVADVDSLCAAVESLSRLAFDGWDEIAVAEINPLIVRERGAGAIAVDGLIEPR
jgi:acyl-CoA synthetase (NDP forming)